MKQIGNLKYEVESSETKEEKKDIIAKAGMELTDDELEDVAGGAGHSYPGEAKKCDRPGI